MPSFLDRTFIQKQCCVQLLSSRLLLGADFPLELLGLLCEKSCSWAALWCSEAVEINGIIYFFGKMHIFFPASGTL